jgi:hypothetical protein
MSNAQNKIAIQHDDLKFDGKNITIPSYWINSICEYIKDYKTDGEMEADIEDYKAFQGFLWDIQEYKNKGN